MLVLCFTQKVHINVQKMPCALKYPLLLLIIELCLSIKSKSGVIHKAWGPESIRRDSSLTHWLVLENMKCIISFSL